MKGKIEKLISGGHFLIGCYFFHNTWKENYSILSMNLIII